MINIWCYSAAQIKNAFRDKDNIGNVSFSALLIELLRYFVPVLVFLLKYLFLFLLIIHELCMGIH